MNVDTSAQTARRRRAAFSAASVVVALLLLTGCAPAAGEASLEEAKERVLAKERSLVSMIDEHTVGEPFISETSGLMSCEGDRKKWTGTAQVELAGETDADAVLDSIRDVIRTEEGWQAEDDTNAEGERTVDITHENGAHLMASVWGEPRSLQIDAFSGCFDFPEYEYGEEY